ncbi:pyridoxamine 5'-phosphate oxidase family protein [Dactylosporangium salmoneum]|uniref:Pyridoxamine 5'-phosphate oxidase family protein n=2 Tax=Dactylosporangium salmoneum TaxID=53361 RepID=A0ABP5TTM7_9ACTN
MPGYGIDEGEDGLLEWDMVLGRLRDSHNYWLVTVRPDGRPHAMPVWGVWLDGAMWWSSSVRSRKIRNLRANPACTMTTEDGRSPVILDGAAEIVTDGAAIRAFLEATNLKYDAGLDIGFLEPSVNATVRVAPREIFALEEARFVQSPTKFTLDGRANPTTKPGG